MTTARVVTTIYVCLGPRSRRIVVTTLAVVILVIQNWICYTAPWRDVRVVECAALEKR
jgi:hypothetical protein